MKYYEKYAFLEIAEKMADAVILSLLWLLLCIPVVTIVPSGAALYYSVVKNLRRGRGKPFSVFWKSFRGNLKQGIGINILICVYGMITVSWLLFAEQFTVTSFQGMLYKIIARSFLLFGMFSQVYLCPVLSRFRGTIKTILMGTVYMSYRYLLTSLCAVIVLAGLLYAVYVFPLSMVFVPALYMYLLSLLVERNMKKYAQHMGTAEADQWYLE